ncbi:MAG: protein kinase, partial [Gemmatimonadota bacterium]
MDAPVCNNCSTPLPEGSKYCNECGTPVPGQVAPRWANGYPTDLRQALQMATAGEYEIHHELGRGGMGSVFLAREIGLDRLVAIKVLPPSLMFDEGLIERFKREARMVAKLHHPNIIPVYRVHHSHNLAFYTMHFVPGRSLSEIMGRNRVPALQEVERTMLEAAAGLGYAHKRGVIHRDVKPANVLIDAEGHVHLTDFGIAKALVGSTQLTETGAVIGTPQYMAPEQCEGRLVDGRADQYSLAAVGYQLLTGRPPFQSESMKELLYHHLFTPPRPINALRADTPLGLRDAIHKALSKDPVDRFDTMEDFAMAIEGKGPPIFVRWIDKAQERRRTPPGGKLYRRATDPPTTERLLQSPWVSEGNREVLAGSRISVHRRAMGALAATVLIIGAVAVLALSRGAGLAGSLGGDTSAADASEDAVSQAGLEPGAPGAPLAGR